MRYVSTRSLQKKADKLNLIMLIRRDARKRLAKEMAKRYMDWFDKYPEEPLDPLWYLSY